MILSIFLQTIAITFDASSHASSLEEMAKAERPYSLACGLDQSLHVPSNTELKGLRQEAKDFQDNSSLRETWVVLEARKGVRKYLAKNSMESCDEASMLRDEALNLAYGKVDAVMPLKRQKRFFEVLAKQSRTTALPSTPIAHCDSTALRAAIVSRDSLQAFWKSKRDTVDHLAATLSADTSIDKKSTIARWNTEIIRVHAQLLQSIVTAQSLSKACMSKPESHESGATR